MKYKKLYDTLIENEELTDMFPGLIGEWAVDKKQFIILQKQMEDFSINLLIEDEEDYGG